MIETVFSLMFAAMPTPDHPAGDHFTPQALSTFSYVIREEHWNEDKPIEILKEYYEIKKLPAVIGHAIFKNGKKFSDSIVVVGHSYSPKFPNEGRQLVEAALSEIDPQNPHKGAASVLILLRADRVVEAIAVAIPNYSVSSGAVLDHNGFVESFSNIANAVP